MVRLSNRADGGFFKDNRNVPNLMIHDREKLYEDTLNFKSKINSLNDENIKFKTRI